MRAHAGDAREPQPVRAARAEVPPREAGRRVGPRRRLLGPALGALGAAARRAGPAVLAHDARRAQQPCLVAPGAERDGSEPRPLRPGAYSRLPARKALASKSISSSLLSRSFPRLGRRRSPAIWKGSASASGAAAEALPTQSARPDGSTPASRATSACV